VVELKTFNALKLVENLGAAPAQHGMLLVPEPDHMSTVVVALLWAHGPTNNLAGNLVVGDMIGHDHCSNFVDGHAFLDERRYQNRTGSFLEPLESGIALGWAVLANQHTHLFLANRLLEQILQDEQVRVLIGEDSPTAHAPVPRQPPA